MQYIPHEETMYRDIADLNHGHNPSLNAIGDEGLERNSFRDILDVPRSTSRNDF
jgi:hypothetical protein